MKRRDFLTGLLLTATTASTQAQQKTKVHRLAVVNPVDPVSDIQPEDRQGTRNRNTAYAARASR
jgi:hypothetical protein